MKFTPNHHKALSLNQCVAEMIVGDINPFSIFERQELCNELECIEQNYHILSLKYISPVVLPKKRYEARIENKTGDAGGRKWINTHHQRYVTGLQNSALHD